MATQDRKNTGSRPQEVEETDEVTPPPAAEPSVQSTADTEGVDDLLDEIDGVLENNRSEERRVGKECPV